MNKNIILRFFKDVYNTNKLKSLYCLLLMLITTFFAVLLPKILQLIIDETLESKQINKLLLFASAYIGINIVKVLLIIRKEALIVKIKKSTMIKYKMLLLKKVSRLSGEEVSKIKTGELLNLIMGDTDLLEGCGIDIVFDTIANIITALSAIIILISMQPDMFLIVAILQVAVVWSQLKFTYILTKKTKEIREEQGGIYNAVQQYLANISLVIMNKAKKNFYSDFLKREKKFIHVCARLDVLYVVFNQLGAILSTIVTVFMYVYGGYKIIHGNMTVGALIAFIQYTSLFLNPCISVLKSNASVQKLKVSIERIYSFLNKETNIKQNNLGRRLETSISSIEFENIDFSYSQKHILNNLNFKLEKGKIYAFVGETGCGKSTIINLIFRWWDVQKGKVNINGINIKEYNLLSIRKQLSIATQDTYIIDGTIRENIVLDKQISEERYELACTCAGIDEIVDLMPNGDQTQVGEKGGMVSGGQKQRIALARILLDKGSVLVLDEVSSALDSITQNKILENIKYYFKNRIVIIITHRLYTIQDVDEIFVMKNGTICEEGKHNQLMKQKGNYYSLVTNSAREKEEKNETP